MQYLKNLEYYQLFTPMDWSFVPCIPSCDCADEGGLHSYHSVLNNLNFYFLQCDKWEKFGTSILKKKNTLPTWL